MLKDELFGLKVAQNGRIHEFGVIRLLVKKFMEEQLTDSDLAGAPYWNEVFVKYAGSTDYWASIEGEIIQVVDKGNGVVNKIPVSEVKYVTWTGRMMVIENGFLVSNNNLDTCTDVLIKDLLLAGKELRPRHFDNSPFVRVDVSLAGREVFLLKFYDPSQENNGVRVLTLDNEKVSCQVEYPLAYGKWGEPLPASWGSARLKMK